ncbi:MAG: NTP transferase domain-containing protein [Candidatus Omnitrophota bacterium]|nr:NTP transferase domain-containing protein [Candidatus Omnitrophota bacterium]
MSSIGCIILAAGKGTRFKSGTPKVLHELHGRPVLQNLLDVVAEVGFRRPVVVIGHKAGKVRDFLRDKAVAVIQRKQLGTADAVKAGKKYLSRFEDILVLYGDVPLVKAGTIRSLIKEHAASGASCTLLTVFMDDPSGYGRIVRGSSDEVRGIVEEKEADEEEKRIREINVGLYCFNRRDLFETIKKVGKSKVKKEYYLTDLIEILISEGKKVSAVTTDDTDETMGINSREDLSRAFLALNKRMIKKLTENSVTVMDPSTAYISPDAKIGKDTVVYPFVVIEKNVKVGKRCSIGPFCRLRPGTVIGDDVEIGNFVEIVRSKIKSKSKAKHLTYLGDCVVGREANIGCGTITANFDGKKKNRTTIGDKAHIGSGTIFVAPVKVGKGAVTGAGSVILRNKNVPAKAVAVGVPARILNKREKR